jgi:hypothetical protein
MRRRVHRVTAAAILAGTLVSASASAEAYSVQAQEAMIDAMWEARIFDVLQVARGAFKADAYQCGPQPTSSTRNAGCRAAWSISTRRAESPPISLTTGS